jgi:hypothetical protein
LHAFLHDELFAIFLHGGQEHASLRDEQQLFLHDLFYGLLELIHDLLVVNDAILQLFFLQPWLT